MRIVVMRPEADGKRSAEALRALGHEVLLAPLMRIEAVPADLSGGWGGVVITSANAIAALTADAVMALKDTPLYAVGRRSADAAQDAGFTDVRSAGGDVKDLVLLLAEHRADARAPLLYLAGEDRAADLVGELALHGIAAELRVVYRAVTAAYPDSLIAALQAGAVDAVLHYSRRSAENYVSGANAAGLTPQALRPRHVCIAAAVSEPLRAAGAARVTIATRPDEAAMRAALAT